MLILLVLILLGTESEQYQYADTSSAAEGSEVCFEYPPNASPVTVTELNRGGSRV